MLELFQYLNSIYPLSADIQSYLMQVLKRRELRANSYWLREGDIWDRIAFIERGLIKIFYYSGHREIIIWFNRECDVVTSVKSFFNQIPSNLAIKTVEPTIINYIEFKDLDYLYSKYVDFNITARKITENY
jgi:hypothetical protein